MGLTIKISSSKHDKNIFIKNFPTSLFNQITSHIIKEISNSQLNLNIYIQLYLDSQFLYYIIKFNDYIYTGKIYSKYIAININFH